jgi:transcriptional regulator with XRE-family HTH domain
MTSGRTPAVTSLQQAREALGSRLRQVRRQAGLTGNQLAERLSWPQSKISKLENARQTPTEGDIRAWCAVCGLQTETNELLAALRTLESRHAEWRRMFAGGTSGHQNTWGAWEAAARLLRIFELTVVPGLLQTGEYARSILADVISSYQTTNDIDQAVASRLARQQILYDPRKKFHFVITEAVLRYQFSPPAVMLAQLDRLIAATAMTNVRLGIIAFETRYNRVPNHGFYLLDDKRVLVETVSAQLNLEQPAEIDVYAKEFTQLAQVASYGTEARAIINRIIDELRPE